MMYYANKLVSWILSPIGILFLACLAGLLLQNLAMKKKRDVYRAAGMWILTSGLVLFWILGCSFTTRIIGVPLEGDEYPPVEALDVEGVDAVVLLGGSMGYHLKCGRSEMFLGADRVWELAKFWKAHHRRNMKIVLSGGGSEESTMPLLKDFGIREDNVLYFPSARNTEEEAKMIASAGMRRIGLVTSAWHMPRARMLFERAGLEVMAVPTDYEMHYIAELPIQVGDFFPSADALFRNSLAFKEWVARFLYALKG